MSTGSPSPPERGLALRWQSARLWIAGGLDEDPTHRLAWWAAALVVATDRLGCLNEVLLTLGELDRSRIPVSGVVLSAPQSPDQSTGTNAGVVARLVPGVRVLTLGREPAQVPNAQLDELISWIDR